MSLSGTEKGDGEPREMEIERLHRPDQQEFEERFAGPGRPVVLTGLTDDWPARDWTPERLAERCGQLWVELTPTLNGEEPVEMSLADYVAYLRNPDARGLYLASWSFRQEAPELLQDFTIPGLFADDWLQDMPAECRFDLLWLFMGPASAGFHLHQDLAMTSAWNVQLSGTKEWLFFGPEESENLYYGEVDAFRPDPVRYPNFLPERAWRTVVRPGELIFTPSGWWHQTRHSQPGIALTANYVNHTNCRQVLDWLDQNRLNTPLRRFQTELQKVVEQKQGALNVFSSRAS